MKQTKQIIQKPIDIDAHLKYRCPQCGYDYWISLREAKTKDFKIVCDCKTVFKPKRVKKVRVLHFINEEIKAKSSKQLLRKKKKPSPHRKVNSKKSVKENILNEDTQKLKNAKQINEQLKNKCSNSLIAYGFTKSEALELITKAYEKTGAEDPIILVKQALSLIGEKSE